jgi:acetoacetate decarboxylase
MTVASVPAGHSERRVFQGREVRLPVVVRDAASGAATYLVDAAAARRLLPDPELDVVELLPGRALLVIACIDYRDNDLGDYNEVSLALFVRRRDEPHGIPWLGTAVALAQNRIATYIHRLPVDQSFTCEVGRGVWGFPKTVEQIDFTDDGGRRACRLVMGGRHVLTLSVRRGGTRRLRDVPMITYSYIDGGLHRTRFVSGAEGVGIRLGGAHLELGDHPIAHELRGLGLPRRALMTVWMEHSHGRFEGPEAVTRGGTT